MNHKTKEYRKLLLKSYGSYLTYRGKALNPEDIEIVFADKESKTGESAIPYLEVMEVVKDNFFIAGSWMDKLFK